MFSGRNTQNLVNRWNADLINQVVVRLNSGIEFKSLLKKFNLPEGISPSDKRLDLRGIDLSHQNLSGPWKKIKGKKVRCGVDLSNTDLIYANLEWVLLPRAKLINSSLVCTNLQNAELIFADLSGANLAEANLSGAWLWDTVMKNANVTEEQLQARRNLDQMDFDYHAYVL